MSASEKLQRWYEYEIDDARGESLTERAIEEMQRLRPQIMAVVQAAEDELRSDDCGQTIAALAALDEALSTDSGAGQAEARANDNPRPST